MVVIFIPFIIIEFLTHVTLCERDDEQGNRIFFTGGKQHVSSCGDSRLEVVRYSWVLALSQCLESIIPPGYEGGSF